MAELLLEIFSEEIPARMQAQAAEDLVRLVGKGLTEAWLDVSADQRWYGPRRIAAVFTKIPKKQPDASDEKKGPQVGAPEAAIQGFLKANGFTSLTEVNERGRIEVRDLDKGKFYFAVVHRKGRQTPEIIKEVVEKALAQFPWPKSMRWGTNPTRWVRPLHSIICLFDGAVVPVEFARVKAGNTTVGHRFLAPGEITVKNAADYTAKLRKAYVVVEPSEREEFISRDLTKLAAAEGLSVRADAGLLSEVIGLVEWPVPLLGTIPEAFMDVPAEVMTSAMRKHQKYFALSTKNGAFANRFGVIANMVTKDKGKAIIAGNERVLSARLSDAKFFWDQDREQPLASRVEKLQERVFQASLGTVLDKTKRLVKLAGHLAGILNADRQAAERAALLCKADLSTGMVGEFPDLQGIMGRYYALHDNEPAAVADAIAEHYSPLGPTDACPSKPLSIVVSLADKLDSLVGFFAINEKPTGSKDPYALRRAALGVIRIILENKLRLPLRAAFGHALAGYDGLKADAKKVPEDVLDFFADRLKVHLREKGVRHDYVSAVFALGTEDDLVRLIARVDALAAFLSSDDGANLLIAYKRAANILRIEEKKDNKTYRGDVGDLGADEAQQLLKALAAINGPVADDLSNENFEGAMQKLAKLRAPVDAFFDKVTVNADNAGHRVERLKLLAQIVAVVDQVADFSKIEG